MEPSSLGAARERLLQSLDGGARRERLITNDRGEPIFGIYYVDAGNAA
jgi:hypothetical protein